MLILCSGPDTVRARRKAKELVAAFRAKHDPSGFSTEICERSTLTELLARIGTPSLFARRRMLRCDGLVESLKIAEIRQLAKRLEGDQGLTILVSVETNPLEQKIEKEFSKITVIHYPHPLLSGAAFLKECLHRAIELGVSEPLAREISRRCDGDAWHAEQELQKVSANPNAPLVETLHAPGSVFDAAEAFLTKRAEWRTALHAHVDDDGITILLNQSRAAARVRDRETNGLHPYTIKRLSALNLDHAHTRASIQRATQALVAARSFATETEAELFL